MTKTLCILATIFELLASTAAGQPIQRFKVLNDSQYDAEVWVWPKSRSRYERPETYLPAHGTAALKFLAADTYWIVGRDDGGREFPLGWISGAELQQQTSPLIISPVFETKTREVKVWDSARQQAVRKTITETVHRLVWRH